MFTSLSLAPIYYIYVRLLTTDDSLKRSYLYHFIPAIVLSTFLLIVALSSKPEERLLYYEYVLIKNSWAPVNSINISLMSLLFYFSRAIFAIQVISYSITGYRLAQKHNQNIANFYSNLEGRKLAWVKKLSITFLAAGAGGFILNLIGRGIFLEKEILLIIPSVIVSSLFFFVGIQGNKQDYTVQKFTEDAEDNVQSSLSENNFPKELMTELETIITSEKLYLNSELRVSDICKKLGTNRTYLSRLINIEYNVSFNDLINRYRLEHAKKLIRENKGDDLSQAYIAENSGFGSVSSLNRTFKKEMDIPPGEYMKRIKTNPTS